MQTWSPDDLVVLTHDGWRRSMAHNPNPTAVVIAAILALAAVALYGLHLGVATLAMAGLVAIAGLAGLGGGVVLGLKHALANPECAARILDAVLQLRARRGGHP